MPIPSALLLQLQELDTKIEQDKYELENFPQLEELEEAKATQKGVQQKIEKVEAELAEISKKQKRLEDEVSGVEDKKSTYQSQLESGDITAPKDLQNLEHAVEGQAQQQGKLEEEILVLMEGAEPIEADLAEIKTEAAEVQTKIGALEKIIESTTGGLNQKLTTLSAKREELSKSLPEEIVEKYEQLATHHQGIAVAELVGDKCHGCDANITHASSEVERLRAIPADELAQCSECQRILIIK